MWEVDFFFNTPILILFWKKVVNERKNSHHGIENGTLQNKMTITVTWRFLFFSMCIGDEMIDLDGTNFVGKKKIFVTKLGFASRSSIWFDIFYLTFCIDMVLNFFRILKF